MLRKCWAVVMDKSSEITQCGSVQDLTVIVSWQPQLRFLWFVKGRGALWPAYEERGIYWKDMGVFQQKPGEAREAGQCLGTWHQEVKRFFLPSSAIDQDRVKAPIPDVKFLGDGMMGPA